MTREDEFIRVDKSFYNYFKPSIVRDERVRRYLKKNNPNGKFYKNWKECSRTIAKKLRDDNYL